MINYINIAYQYKSMDTYALVDFNLEISPGEIVALLGPNGSGKSTALGIGAGWLTGTQGRLSADCSRAFLPQTERLTFAFTCHEYVSFGRAPHLPYLALPADKDRELVLNCLDTVGMAGFAQRRITSLSGGELQLVRIARALAQEAKYLILDEPTDMLDPAHALAVARAIRGLTAAGCGVLLSTHDISFALAVADRVALLKAGRIQSLGPAIDTVTPARLAELFEVPFILAKLPTPIFDLS